MRALLRRPLPLLLGLLGLSARAPEGPTYGIERFLQTKSSAGGSFSPDGRWIAFRTNLTGVAQLWKVPAEGGWPEQLTFFEERVQGLEWSPTGEWIAFEMDAGGNERNQVWLVSPDGARLRNLTNRPEAIHGFGGWSRDGKRIAFRSNRRKAAFFDVYVVDVATGESRCVLEEDALWSAAGFSPEGKRLLLSRENASLDNDLFLLDLGTGARECLTPHEGRAVYRADWSADGRSLFVATNAAREFGALLRLDLETKQWTPLAEPQWDVEEVEASPDGRFLAYATNVDGRSELTIRSLADGSDRRVPFEPGVASVDSFSRDGTRIVASFSGPRDNGDLWVYEMPAGTLRRTTRSPRGGIPREALAAPQLVRYETFDGRKVPALFYRPQDLKPGEKVPCVVLFHGGPEGQSRPTFDAVVQYLVHGGYAVFQPNVRGSTGYGRTFTHLDDVRGREDAVRDGAAGVEWLRQSGVVDPEKIVAYGGSYGGYMVLASLTLRPDLWAAGVDFVGIANFVTFLENTGPYRRRLRASEYGDLETDRDFLASISPIHKVDRIACPLIAVHGANDPRVPIGEAEQIVRALRERGRTVEFLRYEDEGHGLSKLKNRLDAYPKVVAFLDRVLGRAAAPAGTSSALAPASGNR
ncbi:MAG TPA: S9 family peptidase [Planctomycetota bacterium]|jgi:dipeptidyl aminopeptidase/acylaminoacyl peptidase|nr:S9 family peptidase [Planctomycetota bacterium]